MFPDVWMHEEAPAGHADRQVPESRRDGRRWRRTARVWRTTIVKAFVGQPGPAGQQEDSYNAFRERFSELLTGELLEQVVRPGQYLGNEWGACRRPWQEASVRLVLAFPDLYELGMSNFGLRILYQILNARPEFLVDRTYAPDADMEALLRARGLPLWGWESRRPIAAFDLVGFSLQYELTYTNVLNMLDLAGLPVRACERRELFPLVFGGGPSAVNPEPMAAFMDFFLVGDGERSLPAVLEIVGQVKREPGSGAPGLRQELLARLAAVPGVYVPGCYEPVAGQPVVRPRQTAGASVPERVLRQAEPLTDANQPVGGLVPYLALVHDREVLEVRRGCDRGCRFCQPGYTFLPVRERSAEDLLRLSRQALERSGHQEYSMLSLCVSDYTSLHEAVRALNREHARWRTSMSFPSQRADRMNLDLAEELALVRKSGITLAPEAGSERLRAVINKGLNHDQIIAAIEAAYRSGWQAVKLYFMLGLPTETDDDLKGIIEILGEASERCRQIGRSDPGRYRRPIEFTCTISNFVPKPFTPFQWYAQISPAETARRQGVLRDELKRSGLKRVTLNFTDPQISLLEAVISRGDRAVGEIIYGAWRRGATFDAWDDRFRCHLWHEAAADAGVTLEELACRDRAVGSRQPWEIVHVGLNDWWLVAEWEKAMAAAETAPCTENTCHACGVCTELDTTHLLAAPRPEVVKRNPFVKELSAHGLPDSHPSLFFAAPGPPGPALAVARLRFLFTKVGEMRFISHLDLQHLFARAARRAGIALAFSAGFNPAPRLALAVSLPLFQETAGDVGDIELAETLAPEAFAERLNSQLPPEVRVTAVKAAALKGPSLASLVGRARYTARAAGGDGQPAPEPVRRALAEILASPMLPAPLEPQGGRRRQAPPAAARDLRPGIFAAAVSQESPLTISLELACGPAMHVKPGEVLSLVDRNIRWRITRESLLTPEGIPLFDLP